MKKKRRGKGITVFGHAASKGGAMIVMNGHNGLRHMHEEILFQRLEARGVPRLPALRKLVAAEAKKTADKIYGDLRSEGVPKSVQSLLDLPQKAKVTKYCRDLVITKNDLVRLIYNCDQIGWRHRGRYKQFVP